ncbi:MAG: stage V sporulation protein AD, partial [Oscillospiraceae bacterium]|nr:stage V sporulation protein AD [Oscillospiraceae bacterium]
MPSKPRIIGAAAVVGSEEGKGPLLSEFDYAYKEDYIGEKNFELGESRLLKDAINRAIVKSGLKNDDMDMVFAGDLLNQCIASTFGLMEFNIPFSGIYGACSTFSLSLALAGIMADSGAVRYAVAASSSHFCSAERQYRFPLEYGGQRAPTAQRTVT